MADYSNLMIGLVGGMGPYATVDLYRRLVDSFPTEKDWEKPRIIVDSYSTIPSRVRAVLYHEKREEVIHCLAEAIQRMIDMGCNKVIVGCHTAHVFLPEVLNRVEESRGRVVDIIQAAVMSCHDRNIKRLRLLASEGTVETGIYVKAFQRLDVKIIEPKSEELVIIRSLIEDVKQNKISVDSLRLFQEIIEKDEIPIILGCSELPVLYHEYERQVKNDIIDPIGEAIDVIKREFGSI